jgi:hypothetical protein
VSLKLHTGTSTWAAGGKVAPLTTSKHKDVFILTVKNNKQRLLLINTAKMDPVLLPARTQSVASVALLPATLS